MINLMSDVTSVVVMHSRDAKKGWGVGGSCLFLLFLFMFVSKTNSYLLVSEAMV